MPHRHLRLLQQPIAFWAERSRLRQQPQSRRFLVPGQVAKAGRITDLHPAPPSVAELRKAL